MATTAPTKTEFKPVRLWNLQYPNEAIADYAGLGLEEVRDWAESSRLRAGAPVYEFVYSVFTARSADELKRVKEICGSRVVEEDVLPPAKPLICPKCKRDTRSTVWYAKHMEDCIATDGYGE